MAARRQAPWPTARPSLYDFAGGAPALLALTRAHHARCLADPELNHPFSHPDQNPQHIERLAAYLGEVLGGPPTFTEHYADQSAMLRMHAGNGDMSDLGRRFVECFDAAAKDARLPDNADFRQALHDYMEWAVEQVVAYPGDPATVPAHLPMPRWSWNGLQR